MLFVTALAALVVPGSAWAHATLRSTTPPFGHELQLTPHRVAFHFDQIVKVLPGGIEVLNDKGVNFAGTATVNGQNMSAPVKKLPAGAYTVRWRAISADSHVVSGVWTFGVRVPAPAVNDAYGAGGPTAQEDVVRWVWFLSIALAIGTLAFRLICLRGVAVPQALDRKLAVTAGAGVVVALQAGIAAFSLRAEDALQLPFGRFLYGDLSPMAATRFGYAFVVMTLGYAVVLALIYLAWLVDRQTFLYPALVLALVLVSGFSLSGHDAVDQGSSWLSELADWVHIGAASLWIGGLVAMVGVAWRGAPQLRGIAFRRFSELATVSIVLVLAAGIYLSFVRLPHFHDLWTVGYGQVLLVKIGLVCAALAWGGVHKFFVARVLERGASEGVMARVGRSLAGEMLVGVAVLLVAAILVDSRPPAQPAKTPAAAALGR
ncbi:MAG TPA: copper resistance protein CopC [Gaiellaceae bacterium]|nr:copper resistance protein CopC [Gaiellaceae bacterium]